MTLCSWRRPRLLWRRPLWRRPLLGVAFLLLPTVAAAQAPVEQPHPGVAAAAALRARGLELGYNLDHAEALTAFRESIEADPAHPAGYRLAAATMWIRELFRRGAVTAEDFMGQAGSDGSPARPTPEIERAIRDALDRAMQHDRRGASVSLDARYHLGAAHGLLASYIATLDGGVKASFGSVRRAFHEHQKVLDADPRRKDAGLIVGSYRYGVSTLPVWSRLFARLAGVGSGRERGIRLVEEAAAYPGDAQPKALFSLIVIYNREQRYDDALKVIARLQQHYPRNRLLWLEAGSTALRAGRPAESREALAHGLAMLEADARPRAFGELARWRYHHGAALAGVRQWEAAEREFRLALEGDAHEWVRARAREELSAVLTMQSKTK